MPKSHIRKPTSSSQHLLKRLLLHPKTKLIGLAALTLFVYGQTICFEFLWDDRSIHLNNSFVQKPNFENFVSLWTEAFAGLYLPVTYSVWGVLSSLSTQIGIPKSALFHGANTTLHMLNGMIVYAILNLLVRHRSASLAGAALFVIHPIQIESVAYASELRGLLAAFLGFIALYLYLRPNCTSDPLPKTLQRRYERASMLCLLLALCAKPAAAVMPLFAFVLTPRRTTETPLCSLKKLAPWLALSIASLLITSQIQIYDPKITVAPLWARPFIWGDSLAFYLFKVIVPIEFSPNYARSPEFMMQQPWFYACWLVPSVLASAGYLRRQQYPLLSRSLWLFFIGVLPVSGLIAFSFQEWSTVADRYTYWAMLGAALATTAYAQKIRSLQLKYATTGVIALIAAWSATTQVPHWTNATTLWAHAIQVTPTSPRAHYNRGREAERQRDYVLAIAAYNQAIALKPDYMKAYMNRGNVYTQLRDYTNARKNIEQAIALDPNNGEAYNNRGIIAEREGFYREAVADYNQAIKLTPLNGIAFHNRAISRYFLGEYQRSYDDMLKAKSLGMTINPQLATQLQAQRASPARIE